jgi:TRAP-type C4-dicarboxylate transport system permease small subunit
MSADISKYVSALNGWGRELANWALLVMTGLVTADVILRRVFNAPIIFADEVAGYLLVLVTMMGVGYTLQEDGHIQVNMVYDQLPPRKKAFMKAGLCGIGIFYTAVLLVLTGQLTWESYRMKAFAPTPSQILLFPFQIFMPIGCALFLFQMVLDLIQSIAFISRPQAAAPAQTDYKDKD